MPKGYFKLANIWESLKHVLQYQEKKKKTGKNSGVKLHANYTPITAEGTKTYGIQHSKIFR